MWVGRGRGEVRHTLLYVARWLRAHNCPLDYMLRLEQNVVENVWSWCDSLWPQVTQQTWPAWRQLVCRLLTLPAAPWPCHACSMDWAMETNCPWPKSWPSSQPTFWYQADCQAWPMGLLYAESRPAAALRDSRSNDPNSERKKKKQ